MVIASPCGPGRASSRIACPAPRRRTNRHDPDLPISSAEVSRFPALIESFSQRQLRSQQTGSVVPRMHIPSTSTFVPCLSCADHHQPRPGFASIAQGIVFLKITALSDYSREPLLLCARRCTLPTLSPQTNAMKVIIPKERGARCKFCEGCVIPPSPYSQGHRGAYARGKDHAGLPRAWPQRVLEGCLKGGGNVLPPSATAANLHVGPDGQHVKSTPRF